MIRQEQFALGAAGDSICIDYSGKMEGDEMRLTTNVRGIMTAWEGEDATLENFGAVAEELATESQ